MLFYSIESIYSPLLLIGLRVVRPLAQGVVVAVTMKFCWSVQATAISGTETAEGTQRRLARKNKSAHS
jgi:hypothetical protein